MSRAIMAGFIFLIILSIIVSWSVYILIGLIILFVILILANRLTKRKKEEKMKIVELNNVVQREIRIMNDCVQIINTSANVGTVIGRFNDLIALLTKLSVYEKNSAVKFDHELPSAVLVRMNNEKPKIINNAIQRAYDDMLCKCATLKTENGRRNRHKRFFDELNNLSYAFPLETQKFLIDLANKDSDDCLMVLESK